MLDKIENINEAIYNIVSGPFMLIFLVGTGVYLTFKTRFFQIFKLSYIIKNTIGKMFKKDTSSQNNGISSFQAMTTALAGTMGIGNIIGIGTAIIYGGPGSIFWMWVSAFFGCMTKYAEILLSLKFQSQNKKKEYIGGPMYYLEKGLNKKYLAILFCIFCIFASFGIGNMAQVNSASVTLNTNFGIPHSITGICILIIISFAIIGGVKRIGNITEKVIPTMSILYILGGLLVIFINRKNIPSVINLIFEDAFKINAVVSGAFGYMLINCIRYGFSRGVFSNEAGLGSSPIVHAASKSENMVKQGCWGIFEVVFDTIIVCTITTFAILTSGVFTQNIHGSQFTEFAFRTAIGPLGSNFIAISIVFFAVSSILSWAYYGEKCIEYIGKSKSLIMAYRLTFISCIYIGAISKIDLVWKISDTLNCLMAIPNLIGVIGLSKIVFEITNREFNKSAK